MTTPSHRAVITPVIAALLLVVGAWLIWDTSTRRGADRAGQEAVQVARDAIPVLFSYRPDTAEKDLAAARDRLTGRFLDDYSQLVSTVVVPEATQKGIAATAAVPAAAVVSADARHAVVLAYIDQTRTVGSEPPTRIGSSARVTMDKVDGRWLISGFEQI